MKRNKSIWNFSVKKRTERNLGFFNISHEILEQDKSEEKVLLHFLRKNWPQNSDSVRLLTLGDLKIASNKFASSLLSLGLKRDEVVFTLLPRREELYISVLGTLRLGLVFSPLFSSFGPDPILTRIQEGNGKVLITLASYYWKKISIIRDLLNLKLLLIIDDDGSFSKIKNATKFEDFLSSDNQSTYLVKTKPSDPALLHFTSGTTGKPKGVLHAHEALIYHEYSASLVFDLKQETRFWCTADPGWVTGMSYGILAPLSLGAQLIVDEEEFKARRWFQILQELDVEVWYTSPTALRMLMRSEDIAAQFQFPHLKVAASVGEPLNPEIIRWGEKFLGIQIRDNWWQTETGGIMIANLPHEKIKLGSMGKPLPGIEIKIIRDQIAIKKGWPSQFLTYLHQEEKYQKSFEGEWYLSGDRARIDEEGYVWFIGRMDDVIKTSGHLVGPFEIESLLMEHPAVLEAAVIGLPDPLAGELIKAYITLRIGSIPNDEMKKEILAFVRSKAGPSLAPREIEFKEHLPKTRSGKMMRRLLKARALHLPEGDLSTLEGEE